MLTTVIAGRVCDFSHAVGRNAAAGKGFAHPSAIALASKGVAYVVSRGTETNFGSRVTKYPSGPGRGKSAGGVWIYGTEDGERSGRIRWPWTNREMPMSPMTGSTGLPFSMRMANLEPVGTPGQGRENSTALPAWRLTRTIICTLWIAAITASRCSPSTAS